jgi:RNA polymerase sigma-70 factor (ECF subfamily)
MRNDVAEFSQWIRLYTPRLFGVAKAFARDADEAEDLLQELWIIAYRKADQRTATTPVGAWLHAILLSIGRTRWRRKQRRARLFALWHGATDEPQTGGAPEIGPALEHARLWREVARLPDLQRRVLLLRLVEDMSTAQAAAQLGLAEGTIKASLHRALKKLRRQFTVDASLHQTLDAVAPAISGGSTHE